MAWEGFRYGHQFSKRVETAISDAFFKWAISFFLGPGNTWEGNLGQLWPCHLYPKEHWGRLLKVFVDFQSGSRLSHRFPRDEGSHGVVGVSSTIVCDNREIGHCRQEVRQGLHQLQSFDVNTWILNVAFDVSLVSATVMMAPRELFQETCNS